jgi:Cu+-exporting ATPase
MADQHHAQARAIDPVCGMTVDPDRTPHRHVHDGQTYYFCAAGCLRKFAAEPEKYLRRQMDEAEFPAPSGARAVDPVCGMTVDPQKTPHRHDHEGRAYYFCSAGCLRKFVAEPNKYLNVSPRAMPRVEPSRPAPAGTIYTCPMHPEIRQVGPGSCPICGMALEPLMATAEAGPNPELVDMTRRFWIGLVLTLPVAALEMGGHVTTLHMLLGKNLSNWLQLAFATPVVLGTGWPFFVRGWHSLVTRNLNMFTLIAMGTSVAWVYSVVATIVPGIFPASCRGEEGAVAVISRRRQ